MSSDSNVSIRVYKIRWYILAVVCLAIISNQSNWICYSTIANKTGEYYNISYDQVNYLSLTYIILTIPISFAAFILIDLFGLRISLYIGVWLNFIGSLIRVISSLNNSNRTPLVGKSNQFLVLLIGQSVCSIAQPFVIFISTKFANTWFAENQRALANTFALSSIPLGLLVVAFLSPFLIDLSIRNISTMLILNIIYCLVAFVPAFMSIFVTRSTPPLPPSYACVESFNNSSLTKSTFKQDLVAYFKQCAKLFKSKSFIILFFCFGYATGFLNCLATLIEQILCTKGYTNVDIGNMTGLLIVSGLIGSLVSGIIIDKTKKFDELSKICFFISSLVNLLMTIAQTFNNDHSIIFYMLLVLSVLFGFFTMPLLSICTAMSIECVYPIPEATTSGLLFLIGQIFSIFFILIIPKSAQIIPIDSYTYQYVQKCILKPTNSLNITFLSESQNLIVLNFNIPIFVQAILLFVSAILFCIFFQCPYLRRQMEQISSSHNIEVESKTRMSFIKAE